MPIDGRPLSEQVGPFDQRSLLDRIQDADASDVALAVGATAAVAGLAAAAFSPAGRAAMQVLGPAVRRGVGESFKPNIARTRSFSSSALSGADYDEESGVVTLHWHDGSTSEHDCDLQTWLALLNASSKGRFANEQGWGNN